ncbi:Protein MEMO1 like protein [Verticillium longisporum]|nr:Protein MEMO1 like protein [Verticillium longisporum]
MSSRDVRKPGKAGSWYLADAKQLAEQLEGFLDDVPSQINSSDVPIPGARVIIAPHAGYSYSGPTAAWAYKSLDLSQTKRHYGTPFGNIRVDEEVTSTLRTALSLPDMPPSNDNKEHSLEMHLPYLWTMFAKTFGSPGAFPTLVPILVGDGTKTAERAVGAWLLPYLRDPANAFVVSSDFCHWGDNFSYTPYSPDAKVDGSLSHISSRSRVPAGRPIHETIKELDDQAIAAIKTGEYARFYDNLSLTKNTVCGRHPIGVMMAALELLAEEEGRGGEDKGRFQFVRYERSNLVEDADDMSVSYVSAYAVV